ncbi:hypothetical protein MTO96_011345 [Rhipicephalus appendiculatus]
MNSEGRKSKIRGVGGKEETGVCGSAARKPCRAGGRERTDRGGPDPIPGGGRARVARGPKIRRQQMQPHALAADCRSPFLRGFSSSLGATRLFVL